MHLALTHPDVFGVTVPVGTSYDFANDPALENAISGYRLVPLDFKELSRLPYDTRIFISLAAVAAPNPDAALSHEK